MSSYSACYRCLAQNPQPRWRGPKHGWLCLTCFSEEIEPVVQLVTDDLNTVTRDGQRSTTTPLVFLTDTKEQRKKWKLRIFDHAQIRPPEELDLGTGIGAEDAVGEAKWILRQRVWQT